MNHSPDLTSPAPADTYAGDVPRPAEPPQIGPNATSAADSPAPREPRSRWARLWRNLGRDSVLIAPSLLISLIAFPVLITLFSASIATVIVWVGVILLPLTLTVARAFGNLSRGRARAWGAPIAEAAPRPRGHGLRWWLAPLSDARAWLDLLFETVFALPIRLFTFSVCLAWFAGGLGGITHFFWGAFVPDGGGNTVDFVVAWVTNSPVTDLGFAAEATFQFIVGIILLLTFPFVLHAMALLEIVAIRAALSPQGAASAMQSAQSSDSAQAAHPQQPSPPTQSSPLSTVAGSQGWFWLIAAFVGVVLVAVAWPVTTVLYGVPTVYAMLLAFSLSAALLLSVRWPIPAVGLGLVAQLAGILLTADVSGAVRPFTVTSLLALVFLHLIIGLRHRWIHLVALWSGSALVAVLALILPHAGELPGALSNVITTMSIAAGAGIIGVIGNLLIKGRRQLESERELSAAELAKRQELEER
ncbi:MAG TPA: sensor domain-containing protein, partial [Brevibacterium linens]|nr:sensor domain-containing protein [Brevibacterium linens]